MAARRVRVTLLVIAFVLCAGTLISSRPHWLTPHGRATCAGQPLIDATVFRSAQGDIFLDWRNNEDGMAAVFTKEHILLRCNVPAFHHVLGLLLSREAVPSSQCAPAWKGGSDDETPSNVVTDKYAEFPWASCPKIRLDY